MTYVTRDSIKTMLDHENPAYVQTVVGRALVAIFHRQTESEKGTDAAEEWNSIGFSGADAKSGSLTAKYYLAHKTLLPWQVRRWTKVSERTGYPRLCKYHRQLNEIAGEKAASLG